MKKEGFIIYTYTFFHIYSMKKEGFFIVLVYAATAAIILPSALHSPFFAGPQQIAPNIPSLLGGAKVISNNAATNSVPDQNQPIFQNSAFLPQLSAQGQNTPVNFINGGSNITHVNLNAILGSSNASLGRQNLISGDKNFLVGSSNLEVGSKNTT
jgi:hypothetical protein